MIPDRFGGQCALPPYFTEEQMMDLGVADKVFLLAGASKGLGFAIAQELAENGARVFIGSRSQAHVDAALTQLATSGEAAGAVLDASNADSIAQWIAAGANHYGRIDGLLVNAGGPPPGDFESFEDAQWQAAFELTLMSAVRMVRGVLPHLRAAGGGSILTLTSSSIKEPIDILLLSNVMRSGVASLAKSLSRPLSAEGIRINNLVPGLIATERMDNLDRVNADKLGITPAQARERASAMIPMGRYGDPAEFGKAGAFLLSVAASYITGATLVVDGGSMRVVN